MDDDGRPRPTPPMTVRELMGWLRQKDPDFLVVVDAASQSLMVVNPRPGFGAGAESEAGGNLSEEDQRFLRDLHIKHG